MRIFLLPFMRKIYFSCQNPKYKNKPDSKKTLHIHSTPPTTQTQCQQHWPSLINYVNQNLLCFLNQLNLEYLTWALQLVRHDNERKKTIRNISSYSPAWSRCSYPWRRWPWQAPSTPSCPWPSRGSSLWSGRWPLCREAILTCSPPRPHYQFPRNISLIVSVIIIILSVIFNFNRLFEYETKVRRAPGVLRWSVKWIFIKIGPKGKVVRAPPSYDIAGTDRRSNTRTGPRIESGHLYFCGRLHFWGRHHYFHYLIEPFHFCFI